MRESRDECDGGITIHSAEALCKQSTASSTSQHTPSVYPRISSLPRYEGLQGTCFMAILKAALFAQPPRKYQPLPCMMSPIIIWGMKLKTLNGLILVFPMTIHTRLQFCLYIYTKNMKITPCQYVAYTSYARPGRCPPLRRRSRYGTSFYSFEVNKLTATGARWTSIPRRSPCNPPTAPVSAYKID